ncbi:MAG TPA: Rrf2 family transcriptional regulator [Holophagaceae bacterium]
MLPLSQSSGYAVLAMSCLEDPGGKPTLVVDVAARTGFPRPYLSKMIHKLARVGLVMAKRGNKGGVVLALAAREITLDLIAEAVDGAEWRNKCLLGFSECSDERACPAHTFWTSEREHIHERLKGITLEEIRTFEQHSRTWRLADALPERKAKPKPKKPAAKAAPKKGAPATRKPAAKKD